MKGYVTCKECVDLLADYLERSLDAATHKKLDEHIAACPPCLHFLKTYESSSKMVARLRDQEVQIPAEMEERLKSFLKEEKKS